jgi:ATP adenylyltransferase
MAFITSAKVRGCIFCGVTPRGADLEERLVLAVTRHSLVMLNRYPYNNGHLMVAPRKHMADLDRLSASARAELGETLRLSIGILRRELRPDGFNVGLNLGRVAGAGVADHLHWHVVPRWSGDTNFMPVVAETKVMPQHLLESYARLAPAFARR